VEVEMPRLTTVFSARSRASFGDWWDANARDFAWMIFMIGVVVLFAYLKRSQPQIP